MVKIMKNIFLKMSVLLSTVYCANAMPSQDFFARYIEDMYAQEYSIEDMYTDPAVIFVEVGQEFEIRKRCLSEQKWRLQALPKNATFCGLEITEGIWYQNNWVCGGPKTRDHHFRFKMDKEGPVTITFELLNEQNQVEKTITAEIVTVPVILAISSGINDFLHRERELSLHVDKDMYLEDLDRCK